VRQYIYSLFLFLFLFGIDRYVKSVFVAGFELDGSCISLTLAYNTGVAFSSFQFLGSYLKYIQMAVLSIFIFYIFKQKLYRVFCFPIVLLFTGAVSNIYDRFIYHGVVDYIYWHCFFEFAIFNLSDVFIDVSIVIALYYLWSNKKLNSLL